MLIEWFLWCIPMCNSLNSDCNSLCFFMGEMPLGVCNLSFLFPPFFFVSLVCLCSPVVVFQAQRPSFTKAPRAQILFVQNLGGAPVGVKI